MLYHIYMEFGYIILIILVAILIIFIIINLTNIIDPLISPFDEKINSLKMVNDSIKKGGIPKIIHHLAPKDKTKWHSIWFKCLPSWKKCFPEPEYKHIMWNDADLRNFMKKNFAWFLPIYDKYPRKIMRIDVARYFILYKIGGIYVDMDYICYQNFYDLLPKDKVTIVESPYKHNENSQNSLMASPRYNPFWLDVFKQAVRSRNIPDVLDTTGPRLLDRSMVNSKYPVYLLPSRNFNPKEKDYDKSNRNFSEIDYSTSEDVYCRHLLSGMWWRNKY